LRVPPLDPQAVAAQRSVLADVLRWALPTTATMAAVTLVGALVTGMFDALWSRGWTSLVLLAFTGLAAVQARRGLLRRAVGSLIAGVSVTIAMALTFNGGLRSPSAMLLLYLVSLCGWVFGRRGATVMAAIALAVGGLYYALGITRVLPEAPQLPLIGQLLMLVALTALMWSTSALPPERMREALAKAARREQELEAEQARRLDAARQFQAVFDQTSSLMGLVSPDGVLRSVNRPALEFVGLGSADQLVGKRFSETPWWTPANRPRLEEAIARAVAGPSRQHFETTHVDARGRVRNVDFSLSPFRDETGQLRYLIAEGRDITELVLKKERAHTAQRLELVGQLAGGVAHDFNNVLMVILSSAEVLKLDLGEAGVGSPAVLEGVAGIVAASQRASDLTRRLLTFARRGSMARRPLSMHALLESTCRLLQRTLPPTITVRCETRAPDDRVEGDLASLESALINLALNARDAMPAGGSLTFSTERVELDADACRENGYPVAPGAYLRTSVRDTGGGIAPEHQGRVFEPFFTTKEEGKGTGLGLASVWGVLRDHGGMVHFESSPGLGTVFHLWLPLSGEPAPAETPAGALLDFSGVRALVVDDEVALRTMVPRLLSRLGIESVTAASAEEALALYDGSFDLLVSDVVLPGRRGDELAGDLLARAPSLRVLLVSGFPRDGEFSALPAERVRRLAKPFSFVQLHDTLDELLR
jgi:two-component system, cell cycle sensor histidine kinase and response regulator CckA